MKPNPHSCRRAALAGLAAALAAVLAACSSSPASPSSTPTHALPPLAEMLADKTLGSAAAPVTMIEYSSLDCPHCADFHLSTLPQIKTAYIDTGRVRLVYRDYPLDNVALTASMVARCSGSGETYFSVVDALYRSQGSWAYSSNYLNGLKTVVSPFGMSSGDVDACLATAGLQDGITAMAQAGATQYNVTGTPTFVINGRVVVGAQPYSVFASIIDSF